MILDIFIVSCSLVWSRM